jgi:endonuclease-3 related protein
MDGQALRAVFDGLLAAYGCQAWWPARTAFEVMVGAVLTQNTAWVNVERAIARLADRIPLTPEAILALPPQVLADALRPSGYFNVKARRLSALCVDLVAAGGITGLAALETGDLRRRLLAIDGVGPETADDILLYAFERPVFVVDAYTRRVFARLGLLGGDEGYEAIRAAFEWALGPDVTLYNEYHALIVRHGKEMCRSRPRCGRCPIRAGCPSSVGEGSVATAPVPTPAPTADRGPSP